MGKLTIFYFFLGSGSNLVLVLFAYFGILLGCQGGCLIPGAFTIFSAYPPVFVPSVFLKFYLDINGWFIFIF